MYRQCTTLPAVPPRIHGMTRALSRIPSYPRHCNVCLRRRRILGKIISFDCALSGPFDNLFPVRFSASRALCMGIIAVISASVVSCIRLTKIYDTDTCVSMKVLSYLMDHLQLMQSVFIFFKRRNDLPDLFFGIGKISFSGHRKLLLIK